MRCHEILLVLASHLACDAQVSIPTFAEFVQLHKRTYSIGSTEYKQRQASYERRAHNAEQHNRHADRLWTAGVNRHWDWSDVELEGLSAKPQHVAPTPTAQASHIGFLASKTSSRDVHAYQRLVSAGMNSTLQSLPQEKSWGHLRALSQGVRDQGDCGSCWALAATTLLQTHSEIYMRTPRSFSTQEMVSCVPNPLQCGGTGGCKGATMTLALDWAWKNGIANEKERPYVSGDHGNTGQCNKLVHLVSPPSQGAGGLAFGMQGWSKLSENKYEPLMHALVDHGPVGVSVAANEWLDYSSGIFDSCSRYAILNHAVVLFGYGGQKGMKFWSLQNSWGEDWGEHGNMRLQRKDDEESWCGTNYSPEVGTGCKDGPGTVKVCGTCGILYNPVQPRFKESV